MIDPGEWRERIAEQAAAGAGFGCLYVCAGRRGGPGPGKPHAVAVLQREGRLFSLACRIPEGSLPTLTDLFPAAGWDEREAHDLHGIEFEGHEPLRPLVDHTAEPRSWMTPVEGRDVHQVAVGPIHAGVIESGHFRFHQVGEQILALDLRLFYKHRGIEKLMEGRDPEGSLALAGRICGASNLAISAAVAHCWERYLGFEAGSELRRARTLLVELERLYNHLNDIGAICAGVGYSPGAMAFAALKERTQRLLLRLTGHRFGFGAIRIAGSDLEISGALTGELEREIAEIGRLAAGYWREILFSASIQDRLRGTGTVTRDQAEELGLVGPAARASGRMVDARMVHEPVEGIWARSGDTGPLAYPREFRPAELEEPNGDVAARTEIRALEIDQSASILCQLLSEPLSPVDAGGAEAFAATGPTSRPGTEADGTGEPGDPVVAAVEGARGEILAALEVVEGRVARLHLRTASFRNWPALPVAVIGDILPDFPLINKSFELSYAAVDR